MSRKFIATINKFECRCEFISSGIAILDYLPGHK